MWFKNIKLFRLAPDFKITPEQLGDALAKLAFKASNPFAMQTMGWLLPREQAGLVHTVNGQMLLTLRVDKKLLPAAVVTQVARAHAEEIEEQQGYRPGRKLMKEIRERVADELLP